MTPERTVDVLLRAYPQGHRTDELRADVLDAIPHGRTRPSWRECAALVIHGTSARGRGNSRSARETWESTSANSVACAALLIAGAWAGLLSKGVKSFDAPAAWIMVFALAPLVLLWRRRAAVGWIIAAVAGALAPLGTWRSIRFQMTAHDRLPGQIRPSGWTSTLAFPISITAISTVFVLVAFAAGAYGLGTPRRRIVFGVLIGGLTLLGIAGLWARGLRLPPPSDPSVLELFGIAIGATSIGFSAITALIGALAKRRVVPTIHWRTAALVLAAGFLMATVKVIPSIYAITVFASLLFSFVNPRPFVTSTLVPWGLYLGPTYASWVLMSHSESTSRTDWIVAVSAITVIVGLTIRNVARLHRRPIR